MEKPSEKNRIVTDSYGSGAKAPKLRKGTYHAIGAFHDDAGKMPVRGGATVNVKTGYPSDGE